MQHGEGVQETGKGVGKGEGGVMETGVKKKKV